MNSKSETRKQLFFDKLIRTKLGSINPPKEDPHDGEEEYHDNTFEYYQDEDEVHREILKQEDTVDTSDRLINQQPTYDRIINCEVQLQNSNDSSLAKVKRRALGPDGLVSGDYHEDPRLNTLVYEVEFSEWSNKGICSKCYC